MVLSAVRSVEHSTLKLIMNIAPVYQKLIPLDSVIYLIKLIFLKISK